MEEEPKGPVASLTSSLAELFGISPALALALVLGVFLLLGAAAWWLVHSSPPHTLTITTGPAGSSMWNNASNYAVRLKTNGITLKIVASEGSLENLARLNDPKSGVDLGFVQGGVTNDPVSNKLVSLGSIAYAPLLVFYRGEQPVPFLSGFTGKRMAVGALGSGTRELALELLRRNALATNGPDLDSREGDAAANALIHGELDVVFLMSDSASRTVISNLLHTPNIRLYDFIQADGYTRQITYVNKMVLPAGSLDFGKNVPEHDVNLIGPSVELVAKPTLHPALSDLIIEALENVHGGASLFKKRGEFPAPIPHDFPISEDAQRFYKTGKTYLYRVLPYWVASLLSRTLLVLVPLIVVLVPAGRLIPQILQWRVQARINRWYRELLELERSIPGRAESQRRETMTAELNEVEAQVNKLKVPASFANQFYSLRGHIQFVRDSLQAPTE